MPPTHFLQLINYNCLIKTVFLRSVGIILFDNPPCQFPFKFIIIINYYTGTAVLVL